MVFEMEKEFGKEDLETLINMKESTSKTKSKVMESLLGKMEMYIREITQMI